MGQEMDKFLAGLSPACKNLMKRYPPSASMKIDGVMRYILGYGEPDGHGHAGYLILSKINPCENYELAVATKEIVCVDCFEAQYDFIRRENLN